MPVTQVNAVNYLRESQFKSKIQTNLKKILTTSEEKNFLYHETKLSNVILWPLDRMWLISSRSALKIFLAFPTEKMADFNLFMLNVCGLSSSSFRTRYFLYSQRSSSKMRDTFALFDVKIRSSWSHSAQSAAADAPGTAETASKNHDSYFLFKGKPLNIMVVLNPTILATEQASVREKQESNTCSALS